MYSVTAGADTAILTVFSGQAGVPPPTVFDRAETRSLLRLGASVE